MLRSLKIALAQINPTVGDIAGNTAKILEYYEKGKAQGADIVICPELALIGYPPEDLVLMPSFVQAAMQAAYRLAEKTTGGPALIVGCPWLSSPPPIGGRPGGGRSGSADSIEQESPHLNPLPREEGKYVYNAALLMEDGRIIHIQPKTHLPNYAIFDEKRIFAAGSGPQAVAWRGRKLGILVCEDVWYPELAHTLKAQGAEVLIVINASPFEAGKRQQRYEVARAAVQASGLPLVYVNAVGGQDDIVFDGGSFAMNPDGAIALQMAEFEEGLVIVERGKWQVAGDTLSTYHVPRATEESLWHAMALGLRDYVRKNGFPGVVLGLSGGIDSALSAALAADALGASQVKGVLLPSPYTSKESVEDAQESARLLGIETMTVPITPAMGVFDEVLSPVFKTSGWMTDPALGGNVQARLRGMTLMALSNKFGWLLLSTGNKSEIAVGYSTLYGDACGGYNVLKDLYKTQVYELAHWRNAQSPAIPVRSITKAPTAELAPGQKDSDQLPPYDLLDRILMLHLEGRKSAQEIAAEGFPAAVVEKIVRMVRLSEYKRRQSCPGVRLSPMLFGRDRRYPITSKA